MASYFRSNVDAMAPYVPGEQAPPGTKIIKLNTNENPYPPSSQAMSVLQNIDSEYLRRYPDPYANEFRQAVSDVLGVPRDWIIVGNGSDEILNVLIRACSEGARKIVYPMPTYVLYRTLGAMQPTETIEVSYGEDFKLPIEELVAANGAVTLIASPNSPDGHAVPIDDLRCLASRLEGVLAIDEAYVDFAEESALALLNEFDNVISLRTLSKGYSLAGLRLGFGIANPKILEGLFKVKDSYNIDAIACAVGSKAMRDQFYKNECCQKVKLNRTKLALSLQKLDFKVWESQANFLFVQPPNAKAEALYLELKQRGILVRYFKQPGLDDKLRITVGTDEQNQTLTDTLSNILYNCLSQT
ncbi:histidinol-phosphate aminotransferase [Calothrix sp. PCC 7716]|nr:histidinol-phosphate aminotransferase [Calothrix sp. PCC 7716]